MRLSTAILAIYLFLSGCSPAIRHTEPTNIFWPRLPEQPRIHYIQSIYSEDDLGREYSIKEILFGKSYSDTMTRPYSVFVRSGRIYAADILSMRVMIYDLGTKRYVPVSQDTPLRVPSGIVADREGMIYVADTAQSRIVVLNANGTYNTSFLLENAKPVALAYNDAQGLLYVLDRLQYQVIVLDNKGAVRFKFGGKGVGTGQFNIPLGIALDRQGNIYVLDSGNFRVQIFDGQGRYVKHFGQVGDRAGFFSNPKGIAVDSEGHIYVTDAAFSNIQIFDSDGNILLVVSRFGTAPGELYLPAGIYIDENDRIYVADQFNQRICVFQYLKTN